MLLKAGMVVRLRRDRFIRGRDKTRPVMDSYEFGKRYMWDNWGDKFRAGHQGLVTRVGRRRVDIALFPFYQQHTRWTHPAAHEAWEIVDE